MLIIPSIPNRVIYRISFFRYLIILPIFLLLSCGKLPFIQVTGNEGVPKPKPVTHIVYKGNDYIVCKLRENETSASLAKNFLGDSNKAWMIEDVNDNHISFEKGQVIIIPREQKNIGGITANGYQTVPVLAYQRVEDKCDTSPCLPAHIFDLQMGYLKDNGYRIISMADFIGFLNYERAIPKRSVIITIDDNHVSTYNITCPILKKYGFNATLFINADLIDTGNTFMTWPQIKNLSMDGFEVGSLMSWNKDFPAKKENENEQSFVTRLRTAFLNSKNKIDNNISQDTVYLVFPFDQYNPSLLNMFDQIGYKIAFSMQEGSNPFFSDPLALKRHPVSEFDLQTFIKNLETFQKVSLR